jgi:ATP-dependent protease ClpP protease subunit
MARNRNGIVNYRNSLLDRICNQYPQLSTHVRDLKLNWYRIRNAADEQTSNPGEELPEALEPEEAEVLIYDEIGGSLGVSADQFVEDLGKITAPKIKLRINSPGGSLFDSIAIYNALVQHPAYVTTYIDSLAASGASIVALSGDKIIMMNGSQMMIHDALGLEMGNAADMEAMAKFLNRQSENIADIYANKASGTRDEWRARMLEETWMFGSEAVELGLADEVYSPPKSVEKDDDEDGELPEEEEDEGEEDEELDEALAVSVAMKRTHNLRNRGYKYAGRLRAPSPFSKHTVNRNAQILRDVLAGKVN